jgi:hypothetical protein
MTRGGGRGEEEFITTTTEGNHHGVQKTTHQTKSKRNQSRKNK